MSPGAGRVAWGIVTIVSKERYLTKTQNGRYQQKIFNFYILFVNLHVTLHNKINSSLSKLEGDSNFKAQKMKSIVEKIRINGKDFFIHNRYL